MSYGSNLSRERLDCYLAGGRPSGALRAQPGARDPRPPSDDRPVDLPGRLFFRGESTTWGGGTAFYDHDVPGPTAGRAFRVTSGQLADIAEQEMHRDPVAGTALEAALTEGFDGRFRVGPGRYETVVAVGQLDGLPMYTVTCPRGHDVGRRSAPSEAYLATLRAGLAESRGWGRAEIDDYLGRWVPVDPLSGAVVPPLR